MAYTLQKKDQTFVDVSLAFEPNPLTGDITLLLDSRAITNAMRNLILTAPSEVPFDREVGSQVRSYLFDLIDEGSAGLIYLEIQRAIKFGEPRVKLESLEVKPKVAENHFLVNMKYKIVGYDEVYTVSQILEPTR